MMYDQVQSDTLIDSTIKNTKTTIMYCFQGCTGKISNIFLFVLLLFCSEGTYYYPLSLNVNMMNTLV